VGNDGVTDTDGDNLTDTIEIFGLDVDGDGVIGAGDVDLPALGANPLIPDVFVEVDYSDHPAAMFRTDALDIVVDSFRRHGFSLHVDLGTAAPGAKYDLGGGNAVSPPIDVINQNGDVRDYLGPDGFRHAPIGLLRNAFLTPGRDAVFYYGFMALAGDDVGDFGLAQDAIPGATEVIIGSDATSIPDRGFAQYAGDRFEYTQKEEDRCCDTTCTTATCKALSGIPQTGQAHEMVNSTMVAGQTRGDVLGGGRNFAGAPGNTMAFVFSSFAYSPLGNAVSDELAPAVTFMHELGHNLGLCHGGGESINRKPNYISIMNYTFAESGIPSLGITCWDWLASGRRDIYSIDYSDTELAPLDEKLLLDLEGIRDLQGVPYQGITRYHQFGIPGGLCIDASTGEIDYRLDGTNGPRKECTGCDINASCRLPEVVTCPTPVTMCHEELLTGFNDWENISFAGVAGALGPYPNEDPIDPRIWGSPVPGHLVLDIDLKPGSDSNPFNPGSHGVLPVAVILPSTYVSPGDIVEETITFGRTGTEAQAIRCHPEDGDGNGTLDLLCHFEAEATGLSDGDQEALLFASTIDGIPIFGRTSVRIVPPIHP